jgi:hypothetical protein
MASAAVPLKLARKIEGLQRMPMTREEDGEGSSEPKRGTVLVCTLKRGKF